MKQLNQLMQEIKNNKIPHFNLFVGEEIYVMHTYESKISEKYKRVYCGTVQSAISNATKKSFDNSPKCYIIMDDLDFLKGEKIWDKVVELINNTKHIIIIKYSQLDKRKAFYKHFENEIVMFEPLTDKVWYKYAEAELPKLSSEMLDRLHIICGDSMYHFKLEAEKIICYSQVTNNTLDESARKLLKSGVIYEPIGDITFKLTDAILTGDFPNVEKYLYQAHLKEEPAILVLSVLYTGFKQILMYQGLGADKSDAVRRTGMTAWQIKQAKEKMGAYSIQELIRALSIVTEVEQGIKLGTIDNDVALDYTIINIMKN